MTIDEKAQGLLDALKIDASSLSCIELIDNPSILNSHWNQLIVGPRKPGITHLGIVIASGAYLSYSNQNGTVLVTTIEQPISILRYSFGLEILGAADLPNKPPKQFHQKFPLPDKNDHTETEFCIQNCGDLWPYSNELRVSHQGGQSLNTTDRVPLIPAGFTLAWYPSIKLYMIKYGNLVDEQSLVQVGK